MPLKRAGAVFSDPLGELVKAFSIMGIAVGCEDWRFQTTDLPGRLMPYAEASRETGLFS